MNSIENKIYRYQKLSKRIVNWKDYLWRKLIGFNESFEFEVRGFRKVSVPKNMLSPFKENFLDEIYFKHIPENVFKNNTNPVIVDIGANVGYFSLAAFSKFPNAKVYAFEPHPFCYKELLNYKSKFGDFDWHLYQQAVSDQDEEIYLNTSSVDEFTTVTSVFKNKEDDNVFAVKSVSFDSFIEQNKISVIDFIKLDCEGSEYSILYSLSKENFKNIKSLCIETHKGEAPNQNIDFLNNYIQNLGYETKVATDGGYAGYIWAWQKEFNKL